MRYISLTILFVGISLIWSTVAYSIGDKDSRLPQPLIDWLSRPLIRKLTSTSSINQLTFGDQQSDQGYFEPNWASLVQCFDKILFFIYLITMLALHV